MTIPSLGPSASISMTRTFIGLLLALFCAARAAGQSPLPAGSGRLFDASIGYEFVSLGSPSSSRRNLNGADASFTMVMLPQFGVKADVGYATVKFSGGLRRDLFTYLGGPVFYPTISRHYATYVQGLVGGAKVSGPEGYVNRFSLAFGGGAEIPLFSSFAMRVGADYLHTTFFNNSFALRGQNNLRVTVSVVYIFGRASRFPLKPRY